MMEFLNVVAVVVAGLMVGGELAIVAFIHPTLDRLPDNVHLPVASELGCLMGEIYAVLVHSCILAHFGRSH